LSNSILKGEIMRSISAQAKLRITAQFVRALSMSYAIWVLWRILRWWLDGGQVIKGMGRYLNRDLTGMADWQRMAALGLDLAAWGFLFIAVMCCWRFLSHLRNTLAFTPQGAKQLMRCAQMGLTCEALTLLSNPVKTYFLTAHLGADQQVWNWGFSPSDLLGIILCVALLLFAFVYVWALEIADENKGFV
jgi:hypothetical protein